MGLCGRNSQCHKHPGNRFLRDLVRKHCKDYQTVKARREKYLVVTQVTNIVKANGGRFLKYQNKEGFWIIIDDQEAYNKVSHSLRMARDVNEKKVGSCKSSGCRQATNPYGCHDVSESDDSYSDSSTLDESYAIMEVTIPRNNMNRPVSPAGIPSRQQSIMGMMVQSEQPAMI